MSEPYILDIRLWSTSTSNAVRSVTPTLTKAQYGLCKFSLVVHLISRSCLLRELLYRSSTQRQTPAFYNKIHFRIVVSKQVRCCCCCCCFLHLFSFRSIAGHRRINSIDSRCGRYIVASGDCEERHYGMLSLKRATIKRRSTKMAIGLTMAPKALSCMVKPW